MTLVVFLIISIVAAITTNRRECNRKCASAAPQKNNLHTTGYLSDGIGWSCYLFDTWRYPSHSSSLPEPEFKGALMSFDERSFCDEVGLLVNLQSGGFAMNLEQGFVVWIFATGCIHIGQTKTRPLAFKCAKTPT